MSQPASKPRSLRSIKAACLAAMLAAFIACIALSGCGSSTLGQSEQTFKDAFVSQGLDAHGTASNDFVKETPYSMTSFTVGGIEKRGDDKATAEAKVTVENESFTSEIVYECTYTDNKDNPTYIFDFKSAETAPKKGIDFDSQHSLYDCDSTLSDDKASCTVVADDVMDAWFVESENETVYTYSFNGEKWRYTDKDESRAVEYKNIEGGYYGEGDGLENFATFEISGLDAKTGRLSIAFDIPESSTSGAVSSTTHAANGTLQATIEPKQGGSYALDDGYSYYFEAAGTSSGGQGDAQLKGYFTTSPTGEQAIELTGGFINVSYTYLGSTSNSSYTIKGGTMRKQ